MEIKNKKQTGFTLIELLVVIAIIGLLASVVLVALNGSRMKARDAKRVADLNQILKGFELFFNSNYSYPTTANVSPATYGVFTGSAAACASAGCVNNFIPNIIVKVPVAPTPAENSGVGGLTDCGRAYGGGIANDYQYAGTNGANTVANFTLTFCLGGQTGSLGPGVHTVTNGGFQ